MVWCVWFYTSIRLSEDTANLNFYSLKSIKIKDKIARRYEEVKAKACPVLYVDRSTVLLSSPKLKSYKTTISFLSYFITINMVVRGAY